MEIKEVQSKKLFKEFSIEIPGNEIEEKINLKIKELIPKTNLPGFRPGKAPLNIVKKNIYSVQIDLGNQIDLN